MWKRARRREETLLPIPKKVWRDFCEMLESSDHNSGSWEAGGVLFGLP